MERGLGTRPRVYMRGDYYVVPPNGARIHVYVGASIVITRPGAPESGFLIIIGYIIKPFNYSTHCKILPTALGISQNLS